MHIKCCKGVCISHNIWLHVFKKSYDVLTSLKNWIIFYWWNEKQKWTIHEKQKLLLYCRNNSWKTKTITILSEQFQHPIEIIERVKRMYSLL